MQAEVAVHGHGGRLTGRFRRGGFPGNDRKPVGPVESADGTVGGYGAEDVRHDGQCIWKGDRR